MSTQFRLVSTIVNDYIEHGGSIPSVKPILSSTAASTTRTYIHTLTGHECNRNNLFFIRTYVRTFHGWELPSSTVFGESPRCGHSACMRAPVPSPARDDKYIVFRFRSPRRTLPSQVLPILYALVRHSPILRCVLFQDHAHIHAQKDTRSNKPRTNKQKRLPK